MKQLMINDMKEYMKNKSKVELTGLRMAIASIKNAEIALNPRRELTDDEIIAVLKKQVKEHKESLEYAISTNNENAQIELNTYISTLQKYLPKEMDEATAREIIAKQLKEHGIASKSQQGLAMKTIMPVLKGKLDGKIISKLVSELLA